VRRSLIFVVFAFHSLFAGCQGLVSFKKPDPSVPPFAVTLKKSVMDIEVKCKDGQVLVSGAGTAFLVALSDPRLPNKSYFDYLVTNRHVVECWDAQNHPREVTTLLLRVNTKDGSSRRLVGDTHTWSFPNDDSIDLAAMSVVLPDDADTAAIPVEDFATKEFVHNEVIAEGSPIILSGYFYQFPGERRMEAIVRQGILSMVPDEPIKTTTGKLGTVYLGDVHIFGGNSGSPVMVEAGPLNMDGYHLLGVVSGYYYEDEHFNLEVATTVKGTGQANSGIAMIVPVDFLKALLETPELKAKREAYFSRQSSGPQKPQ
jgi:S1-C subfamily serine protease